MWRGRDVLDAERVDATRELAEELREAVLAEGVAPEQVRPPRWLLDLRYEGSAHAITVPEPADGDYREAFRDAFKQLFGFETSETAMNSAPVV